MKVFISQIMNGKTNEEIITERELIIQTLKYTLDDNNSFEIIDSILAECNRGPVWCLGESIKLLSQAELAVFTPNWRNARGCRIEHQICEDYGIKYIDL